MATVFPSLIRCPANPPKITYNEKGEPIDEKGIPLEVTLIFGKLMYFNPYLQKWKKLRRPQRMIRPSSPTILRPLKFKSHQRLMTIDPNFYHDWARRFKLPLLKTSK